jgi:hypothetical protein
MTDTKPIPPNKSQLCLWNFVASSQPRPAKPPEEKPNESRDPAFASIFSSGPTITSAATPVAPAHYCVFQKNAAVWCGVLTPAELRAIKEKEKMKNSALEFTETTTPVFSVRRDTYGSLGDCITQNFAVKESDPEKVDYLKKLILIKPNCNFPDAVKFSSRTAANVEAEREASAARAFKWKMDSNLRRGVVINEGGGKNLMAEKDGFTAGELYGWWSFADFAEDLFQKETPSLFVHVNTF